MADTDAGNQKSEKSKAEGEPWSSEQDTAAEVDRDSRGQTTEVREIDQSGGPRRKGSTGRNDSGVGSEVENDNDAATRYRGTDGDDGGITNRPLDEERENQEALPERGKARAGANAGHGHETNDANLGGDQ
ncbi:MAG: hypothetical protein LC753_01880 [Acidobacteria bacterium]|nr:hypothetical protein [Acidobacteriota bacterium]MCA1649055.1 hypothetical protein [Acidobacteriota bacterium]